MKGARAKVADFLRRVPDADAATMAKALKIDEVEVRKAIVDRAAEMEGFIGSVDQLAAKAQPIPSLRQLFDAFTRAAAAVAETRAPMRQTSARTSLEEMEQAFQQLLDELGEEP